MTGRVLGACTAHNSAKFIVLDYIATVVTQAFFTAPFACLITDIVARPRVAGSDGSAVSLSFYNVPSGVAVASGTLLHSGSYNMKGTADTNQVLTLVTDPDVLRLDAGDSIGFVVTGTATAAIGVITIALEPI
jgi:hypothetical protein